MKEMTNDELPDSWITGPLQDIAHLEMGQSPDSRYYNETGEGVPFFQGKAEFGKLNPKVRKWCSQPTKLANVGDILLSVRAPVGPTNIADVECCIGRGLAAIRAHQPIRQDYLHAFFRFIEPWLSKQGTGSTFTAVSGGFLREIEIAIAPLAEQKRIADKLEAVLGRVDACRARLDRVPDLLKRFRQSVLAAATSGQLTEDWREEHKVSQEWVETSLGKLIADGPKNGLYKASTSYGQGTRILRIDNFYAGFIGAWSGLKRLTVDAAELEDFGLKIGDIVVNRVNSMSHLGKSALVRELPEPCVFESNMMRIRLDVSRLLPEFGILVLTSPEGIVQLQQNAKQAVNQASINQGDVQAVIVAVPSITEQAEIVRRVEALLAMADRIEARLSVARVQLERLTPATLNKAFRGDLVPQDPNDEPASKLLEQLQSAPAPKTSRKR